MPYVDQEVSGGIWVALGVFDLDPAEGHRVVLSDDADETVIADDGVWLTLLRY